MEARFTVGQIAAFFNEDIYYYSDAVLLSCKRKSKGLLTEKYTKSAQGKILRTLKITPKV